MRLGVQFDNTVNLGHILIMVGGIGGGIAIYAGMRVSLNEHEMRLTNVEAASKAQWAQLSAMQQSMYSIQSDVAVIRDRIGRGKQ